MTKRRKQAQKAKKTDEPAPHPMAAPKPRFRILRNHPPLAAAALIVMAICIAYSNSLSGEFIFDDLHSIPYNPTIRRLSRLDLVFSPPGEGVAVQNRPVVNLTLAINYALGGLRPSGYHLFNLGIHIVSALALFGIVRRTLLLPKFSDRFGSHSLAYAVPVALLWALHPLNTEAVTYIIQRTESLFSMFYLLTLYFCIRGHGSEGRQHWQWYGAAIAACLAGMGSKEAMVTAPVMVLLYDRVFVAGSWKEVFRRRWGLYAGLAATWLLLALILARASGARGGAAGFGFGMTWWEYARTQFWAICRYLRLTFWPAGFIVHYGTWIARTPAEIIPYAVVVAALAGGTLAAYFRWPWVGFLGTWFFVVLAPSSSIVPLVTQTVAEKRMYLPLAAIVTLVVFSAAAVGRRLLGLSALPEAVRRSRARAWAISATAVCSLVLGVLTLLRNHDYRSPLAIWDDPTRKRPDSAGAYLSRAAAYENLGEWDLEIADCNKALELLPNYADVYLNRGNAYLGKGDPNRAIADFTRAIELRPNYAQAYVNRGNAYADKGDNEAALADYSKALEINPLLAEAFNNRGLIYGQAGDYQRALEEYSRALAINPDHIEAHANRAVLLIAAGEFALAQSDLRALKRLGADGPLKQIQKLLAETQTAPNKP
ncbi:MAG: tetratricopeptide repeat protein [Candidatus Sumerlaeia bacterium]|nr:tetratricopeptide repeat protein [Candidatus Sumerlaeia bacterium]